MIDNIKVLMEDLEKCIKVRDKESKHYFTEELIILRLKQILDKYNNQDYKSAWEELKQYQIDLDKSNRDTLFKDNSDFYHYQRGNMMGNKNIGLKIKELSDKYNLGGQNDNK